MCTIILHSLPNIIHDQIIFISLCWYSHIYYTYTCCDTAATDMYDTRPTMHRTHCCTDKIWTPTEQSLSNIIHSHSRPDHLVLSYISSELHHPNMHIPQRYLHCRGTTPCSCLCKDTEVSKNQHVEPAQLLELIVLHMQIATRCRYLLPNTHIDISLETPRYHHPNTHNHSATCIVEVQHHALVCARIQWLVKTNM